MYKIGIIIDNFRFPFNITRHKTRIRLDFHAHIDLS